MDDRTAHEREEPPLVHATIVGGLQGAASTLRTAMRAVNERVLIWCWGLGTIAMFGFVLIASIAASPSIVVGIVQGFFAGLMIALFFAVAFGSLLLWARETPKPTTPASSNRAVELDARLASALQELNTLRADIIEQVKARSITRVPLGIAAGVIAWMFAQQRSDPPGFLELVLFAIVGAAAGEYWAARKLERQYRRRYKDRVLPQIAADLGNFTYRQADTSEVQRLGGQRIVPDYDSFEADDEIRGTHDGLPIRIVEVCLRRRQQKKSVVVFDGLFVAITLPRSLTATTVVLTDRGVWDNFKTRWRGGLLEVVRLEHLEFEQRFEVYSTDQVEARALLTPAFMERFVALQHTGFSVPGAIAEGNTLIVALPKRMGTADLFEPPAYWKPAGGAALVRLENDIRAVLRMADVVIQLDFWAVGRQRDVARGRVTKSGVS